MASINIGGGSVQNDIFYRYKMPKLIAKVEGCGNGIKTVIVNMAEISKALKRPAAYPTKFFGCELGAQTQIDTKNDKYIVNGSHQAEKLQEILGVFIKKFVLCSNCDNPETDLDVRVREKTIKKRCKACGASEAVDPIHRLTTYMLKDCTVKDNTTVKDKKGGRRAKGKGKGDEAPQPAQNETPSTPPTQVEEPVRDDDDDWAAQPNDETEELSLHMKGMFAKKKERMDEFRRALEQKALDGVLGDKLALKDLAALAKRLDMAHHAPKAIMEALFNENMEEQCRKFRLLLLCFCNNDPRAQKSLLAGFEILVHKHQVTLMERVLHMLKFLYDEDILDEDVLKKWHKAAKKKPDKNVPRNVADEIHRKADPFIKWLEEAEEEESDDEGKGKKAIDGDHDEDEITFDSTATGLKQQEAKTNGNNKAAESSDDDINIDEI